MKTENYAVNGEGSELDFAEDVLISLKPLESFSESLLERMPGLKPKEPFRPDDTHDAGLSRPQHQHRVI